MEKERKLLTIGQFAALHGINKKTLMWYDQIGLFRPAAVNPVNGYRCYDYHQSAVLETILLLRELDVSIQEIQDFMKDRSAEHLKCLLEEKIAGLDRQLRHLQAVRKTLCGHHQNMVTLLTMDLSDISIVEKEERCYYDKGLRMIEVYKHQFDCLSEIIETIKDRNYKFIIYMDDLSFEDFEIEYKYLKAIIEGGLGKKPDNVLIYATSNRRHLVREKFSDKEDRAEDLHTSDTVQEKLSLVARFGVSIYYIAPNKKEFQNIVRTLAERYHIQMPEEELFLEANKWELSHGGLSGRTAQQFINYLLGFEAE